jgi:AGCS family alanine or glycine:cation symporter
MQDVLNLIDSYLGSAFWFPYALLGVGLFFSLYLGFPQIRLFRHGWAVVTGKFTPRDAPGDTSHFQALATALSGTVGTGNIGGVALALYLGGPAALFWMWATAFFGMTTKFVEVTLAHKYREKDAKGFIAGGPMYYMEKGLQGTPIGGAIARPLAVAFAIFAVVSSFGSGNMPQSNNIASGIEASFGVPGWVTGGVLSVLLALVIVGGIYRIALVAARIVPAMAGLYLIGAFAVLVTHPFDIVPAFLSVFANAFTGSAAAGGFLGATVAFAFNRGVNRGLFSNEAGQGSAPIAHAAARGEEPVSEGVVAILEPFIDTICICTITGLVILASGVWTQKHENVFDRFDMRIVAGRWSQDDPAQRQALFSLLNNIQGHGVTSFSGELQVRDGRITNDDVTVLHARSVAEDVVVTMDGAPFSGTVPVVDGSPGDTAAVFAGRSLVHSVPLTIKAFETSFLGVYGGYIVSVSLILFAFSTAVAWSYYGDRAITYLLGVQAILPYRLLYVGGFFYASVADTSLIWTISYITVALMTLPNLFAMVLLRGDIRDEMRSYEAKQLGRTRD